MQTTNDYRQIDKRNLKKCNGKLKIQKSIIKTKHLANKQILALDNPIGGDMVLDKYTTSKEPHIFYTGQLHSEIDDQKAGCECTYAVR